LYQVLLLIVLFIYLAYDLWLDSLFDPPEDKTKWVVAVHIDAKETMLQVPYELQCLQACHETGSHIDYNASGKKYHKLVASFTTQVHVKNGLYLIQTRHLLTGHMTRSSKDTVRLTAYNMVPIYCCFLSLGTCYVNGMSYGHSYAQSFSCMHKPRTWFNPPSRFTHWLQKSPHNYRVFALHSGWIISVCEVV
jgi:hypothetical protein